uniref:Uncharacterized protein n=1 Tax=Parascaris univalens TaxID=6257 RepID=A0A915A5D6_PARUN
MSEPAVTPHMAKTLICLIARREECPVRQTQPAATFARDKDGDETATSDDGALEYDEGEVVNLDQKMKGLMRQALGNFDCRAFGIKCLIQYYTKLRSVGTARVLHTRPEEATHLNALSQITRLENNVATLDCTRVKAHRMMAKTASTEIAQLRISKESTDPGPAMQDHTWESSKSAEMRKYR